MNANEQVSNGDCVEFYLGDVLGGDSDATGRTQGVVKSIDEYGTLTVFTADENTVRLSPTAVVILEKAQQVKVTEHGFSAHSRRPWDCRICKRPAAIHTYASPESQVTWMNANTADVTARMTKYSDRTLAVVRMAAAQGGDLTEHNLTSCGLHATAVKIVKADGIIENTTPGLGGTWSLTAVGRQLCLHFGIEITAPEVEPVAEIPADDMTIPTNTPIIEGFEWKRHVNPGESVWAGSTYQLIEAGSVCQVAATVKHRGNGLWAAQTCYWGNAGLTKDFWGGEPLADAFANVVAHQDFLNRARAAGLSGADIARITDWRTWSAPVVTDADMRDFVIRAITEGGEDIDSHDVSMIVDMLQAEFGTIDLDTVPSHRFWDIVEAGNVIRAAQDGPAIEAIRAAHDAAMAEWVRPLVKAIAPLPVRTPGGSLSAWDMAEAEIWAGTDRVAKMRFPRKMKKSRRKAHLVDLRAPRPIDVKRARIMGGC